MSSESGVNCLEWRLRGSHYKVLPVLLFLLFLLGSGRNIGAATMTASLDRDRVAVGESATLTLTFEGGEPDSPPAIGTIPNLNILNRGSSRNVSIAGNSVTSTVTQTFSVTPLQPGSYQIPPLRCRIHGQIVTSNPLTLTALKQDESQLAFMRLVVPKKKVFIGQAVPVELQVFVRDGILNSEEVLRAFDAYNAAPLTAEGCRILRTAHRTRQRAQSGSAAYTVSTLVAAITPAKEGNLAVESIKVPLTLQLPVQGQRKRDIFDPFGMFPRSQPREMVLSAPAETLEVAPLPTDNVPPAFNGAVGSYSLKVDAGPTNVAVGDPVTLKICIQGTGNLEALALPEQTSWQDFKSYPPTSDLQTTDALGIEGTKTFEQVLVPQSDNIKGIPPVTFSFFDPSQNAYRSLTNPALPLVVRPGASTPPPAIVTSRDSEQGGPPPPPDIVPIKRRLGSKVVPHKPLIVSGGFLALQMLPVAVVAGAVAWRRRRDAWEANPKLRRKQEVQHKVRAGLGELRRAAEANKSDEFFLTVFRLLQEKIGERLDAPAASITESVIDDELRPKGIQEDTITELRELFQMCNQARYAPTRSSAQLEAVIPRVATILQTLEGLKA